MTILEKIAKSLGDAKGRFVSFELDVASLDKKMKKKDNPFFGQGWTYKSTLNCRAGVSYLAVSKKEEANELTWATREDRNGVAIYRNNNDCRKLYIGVAPNSATRKVFNGFGDEASNLDLLALEPYMKKSSSKADWLTIGLDSIKSVTVNGEKINA